VPRGQSWSRLTLTKEAITRSVFDRLDLSKTASAKAVETTFEIIKKTLEGDDDVLISGFGKFCVKDKGKRRGRNPGTGEDLMLAGLLPDKRGQTARHLLKGQIENRGSKA
jgi:integration host factor subunit alpha